MIDIEFDADSKSLKWLNDNRIYFVMEAIPEIGYIFGNGTDEFFMSRTQLLRFKNQDIFIVYVASKFGIYLTIEDKKKYFLKYKK